MLAGQTSLTICTSTTRRWHSAARCKIRSNRSRVPNWYCPPSRTRRSLVKKLRVYCFGNCKGFWLWILILRLWCSALSHHKCVMRRQTHTTLAFGNARTLSYLARSAHRLVWQYRCVMHLPTSIAFALFIAMSRRRWAQSGNILSPHTRLQSLMSTRLYVMPFNLWWLVSEINRAEHDLCGKNWCDKVVRLWTGAADALWCDLHRSQASWNGRYSCVSGARGASTELNMPGCKLVAWIKPIAIFLSCCVHTEVRRCLACWGRCWRGTLSAWNWTFTALGWVYGK